MNEQLSRELQKTRRPSSREVQSAETQIATADEQIDEMQETIHTAELQIEAMEDEIRKRKSSIRSTQRKLNKLLERRSVFIDAAAALRKLERNS